MSFFCLLHPIWRVCPPLFVDVCLCVCCLVIIVLLFSKTHTQNAIDLDLTLMVAQLGGHSEASFGNAVGIYVNGGNVAPYSNLTLKLPLAHAVPGGTRVTGVDSNIGQVVGFVMGDHHSGSKHLAVKYLISSNQANYVGCKVGGLPSANAQVTEGCKFCQVCVYSPYTRPLCPLVVRISCSLSLLLFRH